MACGKIWAQVNIFLRLFSTRSRTGTSELKEPEWSRCQGRGKALGEKEEEEMNTGKRTHVGGSHTYTQKLETQIG